MSNHSESSGNWLVALRSTYNYHFNNEQFLSNLEKTIHHSIGVLRTASAGKMIEISDPFTHFRNENEIIKEEKGSLDMTLTLPRAECMVSIVSRALSEVKAKAHIHPTLLHVSRKKHRGIMVLCARKMPHHKNILSTRSQPQIPPGTDERKRMEDRADSPPKPACPRRP